MLKPTSICTAWSARTSWSSSCRQPRSASENAQAVVHFDGSARLQTVSRHINGSFWEMITEFGRSDGGSDRAEHSFNVRGEAIVCTPEDAIRCFLSTDIDLLALENYLVTKASRQGLERGRCCPGSRRFIVTGLSIPPRTHPDFQRYWRSCADFRRQLGGNFHA